MSHRNLVRPTGGVVLLAGILRGIASFTATTTSEALHGFYAVIDSLLLLSVIGLYLYLRRTKRWWGMPGFLLSFIGALLLLGHDVVSALGDLYAVAALLLAIGITLLAIDSWIPRALPRWAASLLIASTLVGSAGYFVNGLGFLFVLSGVLFGLGFIGVGLKICVKWPSSAQRTAIDLACHFFHRAVSQAGATTVPPFFSLLSVAACPGSLHHLA